MNKAIFFDRDGTIIKYGNHPHDIKKHLKFIKKSIKGLRKLKETEYLMIIITNQAGIARGMYTEEDYFVFRDEVHKKLEKRGISIIAEYFCPHHPEKGLGKYKINCNCRKPKIGMLEQATTDFDLNLGECWVIGDNVSDIDAGKNAGCRTIHVLTGEKKEPITHADFVAKDLEAAADYILNNIPEKQSKN